MWSPTESHRAALVRDGLRDGRRIRAAASVREAADGADLIVVATASPTPVLESGWVRMARTSARSARAGRRTASCELPWSPKPTLRRFDGRRPRGSRRHRDGDSGRRDHPGTHRGRAGALVSGTVAGRQDAGQVTLFKSLGMAVEDVAAARLPTHAQGEQSRDRAGAVGEFGPGLHARGSDIIDLMIQRRPYPRPSWRCSSAASARPRMPLASAIRPPLRRQAFELAYNLEHDAAVALLRQATLENPSDASAHRALASVLWLNMLFSRGAGRPIITSGPSAAPRWS